MSSPSFTPPPTQPTPTDNVGQSSQGGPGGPSSSLYLYTFLVTLALLLTISASIIVRSYIIRRRIRRMIADGTWVPPEERRVPLGEKPQMFEVYIGAEKGAPLAAAFVERNSVPASVPTPTPLPARRRFAFFHRHPPAQADAAPYPGMLDAEAVRVNDDDVSKDGGTYKQSDPSDTQDVVQLAMFIAMPYQSMHAHSLNSSSNQPSEVELPPLELGVRTTAAKLS